MTRWRKDATEFDVKLNTSRNRDGSESMVCRVPKPIVAALGGPDSIRFLINGKAVTVVAGDE